MKYFFNPPVLENTSRDISVQEIPVLTKQEISLLLLRNTISLHQSMWEIPWEIRMPAKKQEFPLSMLHMDLVRRNILMAPLPVSLIFPSCVAAGKNKRSENQKRVPSTDYNRKGTLFCYFLHFVLIRYIITAKITTITMI